MTSAHKGSRPLLVDQIVSVDYWSAHFNYDYDANGIQGGKLVTPTGTPVYTMRLGEGKFGGAISLDDATTNLYNGSSVVIYNNYYSGNGITGNIVQLPETYYGQPINRLTMTVTGNNALSDMQTNSQGNHGVMSSQQYSFTSGNTYVTSIYWRAPKSDILVTGLPTNNLQMHDGGTIKYSNGWYRTTAYTSVLTGNVTDFIYWAFSDSSAQLNENIAVDWACPQIESGRTYPSSYTVGSRNAGTLQYPISIINSEEGTISFWLYLNYSTSNFPIFSSGVTNAGAFDLLVNTSTGTSTLQVIDINSNSTQLYPSISQRLWQQITITWKRNQFIGLYVNGVLSVSSSSPADWSYAFRQNATGFYIGSGIPGGNASFMIDELRVDNIMHSAEDISAWYISNRPFFNQFDRRSYAF